MKNLVKVKAVFSEDKGLEVKTELISVVKENETAIVLDTEDFKTVYKDKADKSEYLDYIDQPKRVTVYGLHQIVGISGYFSSKEKAEKTGKDEVNKYLTEKIRYYEDLIMLFDNPIKK